MFPWFSHICWVGLSPQSHHSSLLFTFTTGATDGKVSQLERLVFSENFVKEETEEAGTARVKIPLIDQTDKQAAFSRHFGQGNIYDTPDRRGIAVDLLILFRDIHPKV